MTATMIEPATTTHARHYEETIAHNIRMYLTARGITQASLAEPLGIKPSAVSMKMRGKTSWSIPDVVRAADFFGVTPEDLMDDTLVNQFESKYKKTPAEAEALVESAPSGTRTLDTLIKSQML